MTEDEDELKWMNGTLASAKHAKCCTNIYSP